MKCCWTPVTVSALLLAGSASGQAVGAGASELELAGRVQTQFSTTSLGEAELGVGNAPSATVLELRRVYVAAEFRSDTWLSGKLQADLSGSPMLLDGYADARLATGLIVRAGRFKKPFSLLALYRHPQLPIIERSVRIRGVTDLPGVPAESHFLMEQIGYVGRDVGVMVHGSRDRVTYAAGVFTGEAARVGEASGSKAFAGRLAFAPVEPLELGAGVSRQPTGLFAAGEEVMATAYTVEAEWGAFRRPGLRFLGEAVYGDNPLPANTSPTTMLGGHVIAAWFVPREGTIEGLEPVVRASWADPDTAVPDDDGVLLTAGATAYFSGETQFMMNAEAYAPAAPGLDPVFALVATMVVFF